MSQITPEQIRDAMGTVDDEHKVSGLLHIAMSAAIPLRIMELQARGGPSDADWSGLGAVAQDLAEHGDLLLYRGGKKGQSADLFNATAQAIAVLAFLPGGITIFGSHYQAGATNERDTRTPAEDAHTEDAGPAVKRGDRLPGAVADGEPADAE